MKVLFINGSPRIAGNSDILIEKLIQLASEQTIQATEIKLRDLRINPCIGCALCHTQHGKCSQKDDFLNIVFQKMLDADAVYLVTPVYQGGVTSIMKNFMDRCEIYREGRLLKGKLCGGTAIGGYPGGGQELSLMQIQYFAHICAMCYIASWGNMRSHLGGHCIAYHKGEIKRDKEGIISSKNVLLEMINRYQT